MVEATKEGVSGRRRKSIASNAAGNSNKNEDQKMPLWFGDVEMTSDLWRGSAGSRQTGRAFCVTRQCLCHIMLSFKTQKA